MSYSKSDQVFPRKQDKITDAELAQLVATALRQDYGDLPSAVKQIGLQTGANLRAIRNWYEGRHAPSSIHLLRLAKSSPQILQLVLIQVGGDDLIDAFGLLMGNRASSVKTVTSSNDSEIYGEKNCTINGSLNPEIAEKLNRRQLWFLEQLKSVKRVKTDDICLRWGVSARTAKSDLAEMTALQLIQFKGPKKTGSYILLRSS
jgi:hypothetical protein